jgi:hypothetical protein
MDGERVVIAETVERILVDNTHEVIDLEPRLIEVVEVAKQGPIGPPGPSGEGVETVTGVYPASGAVSGHRVVKLMGDGSVGYADAAEIGDASIVVGITLNAAASGADVQVREHGLITEAGWSWTPGLPVWLGSNGHLTQTPPAAPAVFSLAIGSAVASDAVFVRIEPVVLL